MSERIAPACKGARTQGEMGGGWVGGYEGLGAGTDNSSGLVYEE